MKKAFVFLLALICVTMSYAQKEIVYLKNGSIIKGIVIEQVPNESLKIKTSDGSIFAYKMDEILKITKDVNNSSRDFEDEEKDNNKLSRCHFGIRAGYSSSSSEDCDPLPSVYGGLGIDFKIAPVPLYLESGLYYMNKGYKYESRWYYGTETETYNEHSILTPILLSYHVPLMSNKKMSIQPFVGGYVAYETECEEVDYGVRFGCGWNFGRLYANIGYDLGIYEHDGNWNQNFKSNAFFITLGFNFAGSK